MKKLFALILTVILIFSLVSCGNKEELKPLDDTPASSVDSLPEEKKEEEKKEEVKEEETKDIEGPIGSVEDPIILEEAEIPEFSFDVEGYTVTSEELLEKYNIYSVTTTSTNTYGTTTTRTYIGFVVSDVLELAGITDSFTTLTTIADDGYVVKVGEAIAKEPTTLVAVSEDGKMFKRGVWFAPCSSNGTPDYLRELITIELS